MKRNRRLESNGEGDGWMRTECETRGEERSGGERRERVEEMGWNGQYSINEEWDEESIFRFKYREAVKKKSTVLNLY